MNYYKRHLGDYAAATRHLSMIEHGAYTLLLDVYYIGEKPLPNDERAIWRLVGARSKDEREAVSVILQEFFTLEADGWHQTRCDEELAAKRAKAEINREIGKRGGRPKKETVTVPEKNPDGFQIETETVSENNPSHKPIANSQEPIKQPPPSQPPPELQPDTPPGRSDSPAGDYLPDPTPYGTLSATLRKLGVPCMPNDPILRAWVAEGFSCDELIAALEIVRQTKPRPQPVPPRYLDTTVRRLREEAAKPRESTKPRDDWHRTDAGTDRKARELGMFAHGGETYDSFRQRIWAEIKRRENATAQGAA